MVAFKRSVLAGLAGLGMMLTQGTPLAAQVFSPSSQIENTRNNNPSPAEPRALQLAPAAGSTNQMVADAIARRLRASGKLRGYSVDIEVRNGVVVLTGHVADETQKRNTIQIVRGVPGVVAVQDQLRIGRSASLKPAQALTPLPRGSSDGPAFPPEGFPTNEPERGPQPDPVVPPQANTPDGSDTRPAAPPYGIGTQPAAPGSGAQQQPSGGIQDPVPIHRPPMPNPITQPPRMPPYAWPTYAPYNNFSRVAYPKSYPYKAFPFIGPFYPFPKVPLGWRSVTISWEDGYWWYSKKASGHDWWRIRYW